MMVRKDDTQIILEVCDNGPGLASDFSITPGSGLGLRLSQALSEQLHGSLSWDCSDWTRFIIRFPAPKSKK
ncbi:hypothetical protein MASR2M78_37440 [Treponema sp.]